MKSEQLIGNIEKLKSIKITDKRTGNYLLKDSQLTEVINIIKDLIKQLPLHGAIVLHFNDVLLPFLEIASDKYSQKSNSQQKNISEIDFIIRYLYFNCYQSFLDAEPYYSKFFIINPFKKIIQNNEDKLVFENLLNAESKRKTDKIKNLLLSLKKAALNENYKMRQDLNVIIEKQLLVIEPASEIEEIALNWIKHKVETIQKQNPSFLCCRVHFQRFASNEVTLLYNETKNQEFKDYRWPLNNESIMFHLTKTFVGFLNSIGGIIYVGLKEDKNKFVEVKGIELSDQQKIQFLFFLYDKILSEVYPKDAERIQYEAKYSQQEQSLQKKKLKKYFQKEKSVQNGYQFKISNYVFVDFMDVFDGLTYLNSRGEHHNRLYVVRIKIKAGDPLELYHVINKTSEIPQAFTRQEKSVKKKTTKQFHDLFYRKISGLQKQALLKQKKDPHSLCRFNPLADIREGFN